MVHAYVFVKTAAGSVDSVVDGIRAAGEVVEAHVVAGEHDVVAEVDADSVYQVFDAVAAEVGGLDAVTDTTTYVAIG